MDQNTVALLHFDDGFRDECGNVWTATGNPALVTTNKKFGNSALNILADSSSELIAVSDNFVFNDGDFTVDFWMYSEDPKYAYFLSSANANSTNYGLGVCGDYIWIGSNTSILAQIIPDNLPVNTWTHIAVVRRQNTLLYFVQGALKKQITLTSSAIVKSNKFAIGARYANSTPSAKPFYLDEVRISNVARWTETFPVPTQPYPSSPIPAPTNLTAVPGDKKVVLNWTAVNGATGYYVKRAVVAGGPYTTVAENISTTTYEDTTVINGTTYYYIVTAIGSSGESANSNEAAATPGVSGKVLLQIHLFEEYKEYDLRKSEADAFVAWYNAKAGGNGPAIYLFDKNTNIGPFTSRKDYIVFDKVIGFEVKEYLS